MSDRPPFAARVAPGLALTWAGLGLFMIWDGWESGNNVALLMGAAALALSLGNVAIMKRQRRQ